MTLLYSRRIVSEMIYNVSYSARSPVTARSTLTKPRGYGPTSQSKPLAVCFIIIKINLGRRSLTSPQLSVSICFCFVQSSTALVCQLCNSLQCHQPILSPCGRSALFFPHVTSTRSLAIAKRPCDCCIILKSGSYTKAI